MGAGLSIQGGGRVWQSKSAMSGGHAFAFYAHLQPAA
jgi:hypothetical protein